MSKYIEAYIECDATAKLPYKNDTSLYNEFNNNLEQTFSYQHLNALNPSIFDNFNNQYLHNFESSAKLILYVPSEY